MSVENTLKTLGLDEKEAAVYLAGLEMGPVSVQALAIKTKIKRTTVYQVLESLKAKELFKETIKGKKRLFVAAHPNQLKVLQNDRQRALEDSFFELEQLTQVSPGKPKVLYYDTLEGIHKMYEDALTQTGQETIGIADGSTITELDPEWLATYVKKRDRTGAQSRMILTEDVISQDWKKLDENSGRVTKLLSKETNLPVNIEVVGDTVIITSLKNETLGLSIESKPVATAMREILSVVWNANDEASG
jgi:sugar-specific transcriptional regulator TrmB